MDIFPNEEIDYYEWIPLEEANEKIAQARLAREFVKEFFNKRKKLN